MNSFHRPQIAMHTLNCVKCAGVIIKVNNVPYSLIFMNTKALFDNYVTLIGGGGELNIIWFIN